VPVIIDHATWEAVQHQIDVGRQFSSRNNHNTTTYFVVASATRVDIQWSAGMIVIAGAYMSAMERKVGRPLEPAVYHGFAQIPLRRLFGTGLPAMFSTSSTCSKLSRNGSAPLRRIGRS
jgi:hypothetical protein